MRDDASCPTILLVTQKQIVCFPYLYEKVISQLVSPDRVFGLSNWAWFDLSLYLSVFIHVFCMTLLGMGRCIYNLEAIALFSMMSHVMIY